MIEFQMKSGLLVTLMSVIVILVNMLTYANLLFPLNTYPDWAPTPDLLNVTALFWKQENQLASSVASSLGFCHLSIQCICWCKPDVKGCWIGFCFWKQRSKQVRIIGWVRLDLPSLIFPLYTAHQVWSSDQHILRIFSINLPTDSVQLCFHVI